MIAEKLPVRSIARMVGVPTNMENFFHDFAVNVVKSTRINLPVKQREEAMQLTLAGFQYFLDLIKERSEEHTSELQSLMRISYAVFCLKKKNNKNKNTRHNTINKIK